MPKRTKHEERDRTQDGRAEQEAAQPEAGAAEPSEAPGAETEAPPAPEGADLEARLEEERKRSESYLEELRRERADFINFRRRIDQERESWGREANAALIANLLPVLDDFERARAAIPEDQRDSAWAEGLLLVGRKLYATLEAAGLREIEAVGREFDPSLHEAVSIEPDSEHGHSTIVEEYRKGYKLGEKVLRPSMVKVAQ